MTISMRANGVIEAERGDWRCVMAPGDEALAREVLGEAAEEWIGQWTPEQIEAARRASDQ